jgi:chromosome segregation ATPase
VATLTQDLGTLDDDRKALAGRVQYLEAQLAEKELALTSGLRELEGARGDLARSQEDLVRWRREMSTLRERLRNLEKENRDTMEAMIKVLERVVSKESKPGPGEGAPPPR